MDPICGPRHHLEGTKSRNQESAAVEEEKAAEYEAWTPVVQRLALLGEQVVALMW